MPTGKERIYRKNLLHRYGWTETTIKRFLPEPDFKKKSRHSQHYSYAYKLSRIEAIEATEEFQQWATKYQGDRATYKANTPSRKQRTEEDKKRAKQAEDALLQMAATVQVTVPPYTDPDSFYRELSEKYNEHLNYLYALYRTTDGKDIDLTQDPQHSINHRIISFIASEIATYSEPYPHIVKLIGPEQALKMVKKNAHKAIHAAYPWLNPK